MSEPFEFLIEVVDRIPEGYRLRVAFPDPDSPAGTGENRTVAAFDAADAEFRGRLAVLPTSVLASAAKARHSANPLEETARDIGDRLFRAVTAGETLGDLSRLRRRALAAGADVRISLRIQAPELAALPWEYLFDARPDRREFLSRSCMVTRSSGAFGAVPRLAVDGPLRVLATVSVPGDQAALDTLREQEALTRALGPMADRVELHWIPATKQALLAAVQAGPWHVFHYIGHGDFDAAAGEGRLAFTGPDGRTDHVSARQLAALLGPHATLRLVVLNACQTSAGSADDGQAGVAAALVHAGTSAVVAMQFPITDDAAPVFSEAFYEGLAAGRGVDQCVRAGRTAITLANDASLEWGTPVLHLRSADGMLFAFADAVAAAAEPAHRALTKADDQLAETMMLELPRSLTAEADPMLATQLRTALAHLDGDLAEANIAMSEERYDAALVARLEHVVTDYLALYGEGHERTNRASSALSKARRGLAEARRAAAAPAPAPLRATAPTVRTAEDDEEEAPRRKTIRTAKARPRKPVVTVTPTPGFTLFFPHTRIRSLAAAEMAGSLRVAVGDDDGVVSVHSSAGVLAAPSPHPHELTHRESGPDGRDAGPAPVHGILLDPSGRTVACQAGAGRPPQHLVLWTMADVRPHKHPGGHFAYLPGRPDEYVASEGSTGLAIRAFQSDKTTTLEYIETVRALAVSGDGGHIAAAGQNRTRLWTGDGEFVRYVPSAATTRHVALSADGDRLVVPESPTRLAVHDTESGHTVARIPIDADASHAWELGGSGLLVTTTREGLTLWDPESPSRPVHCIRGSFANTVRPAFTPGGDVLVARSVDGTHVHTYRLDVSPVG